MLLCKFNELFACMPLHESLRLLLQRFFKGIVWMSKRLSHKLSQLAREMWLQRCDGDSSIFAGHHLVESMRAANEAVWRG